MTMARLAVAVAIACGSATPATAQVDLSGEWAARQHEDAPERGGGPEVGEYQGLAINDSARGRADASTASLWTLPEHQCIPHPADYGPNFSGVRIWKDVDPVTQDVVAFHTNVAWMNPVRTIWMDGRSHPGTHALHTWEGFSTGRWEGDMLTVETTHLKAGYLRRTAWPGATRRHYNFVDQYNTFGLGANVAMSSGTTSDALYALDPTTQKVVTLRVPYPRGFFTRGLDGRIDDAGAGWKGRGLWAVNGSRAIWHTEGGKGTPSQVAHFQLRPNPLAR